MLKIKITVFLKLLFSSRVEQVLISAGSLFQSEEPALLKALSTYLLSVEGSRRYDLHSFVDKIG
jgi:hypothetical protein